MKDIRDLDNYPFRFAPGWQVRSPERVELAAMQAEAENAVGVPLASVSVLNVFTGREALGSSPSIMTGRMLEAALRFSCRAVVGTTS